MITGAKREYLLPLALAKGVHNAAIVAVEQITFNRDFRKACESNTCGNYNKCWTCPPDCGDIDLLMAQAQHYRWALVYQTVASIEDSYDIEGMLEAGKRHNHIAQLLSTIFIPTELGEHALHLSAGGCRVCESCAKRDQLPCRFPDRALCSLEAYGVSVYDLANLCGMKYINGQNTVTYFGAFFYD